MDANSLLSNLHCLGLQTTRNSSLIQLTDSFVCPLNSQLRCYGLAVDKLTLRSSIVAHNGGSIMTLNRIADSTFFSFTFDGEVKQWRLLPTLELQCVSEPYQSARRYARHSASSPDGRTFALCEAHNALVIATRSSPPEAERFTYATACVLEGAWRLCEFTADGRLLALFELPLPSEEAKQHSGGHTLHVFEKPGEAPPPALELPEPSKILHCRISFDRRFVVLVYQSRLVQVVDAERLTVVFSCCFAGVGALYTAFLGADAFYLAPENGVLAKIDLKALDGTSPQDLLVAPKERFKESGGRAVTEGALSLAMVKGHGLQCQCYNMAFVLAQEEERFLLHLGDTVKLYDMQCADPFAAEGELASRVAFEESVFTLTCCGVDLNCDGTLLSVGDLAGTVRVFKTAQVRATASGPPAPAPAASAFVGGGARALQFHPHRGDVLAVGTMSKRVLIFLVPENALFDLATRKGTVTVLRWHSTAAGGGAQGTVSLLVGDTQGRVAVYRETDQGAGYTKERLSLVCEFLAHEPSGGPRDPKFGSLQKYAEVWSLAALHKDDEPLQFFATCSEDQTTKVWRLAAGVEAPVLEAHLKGHTRAVTAVEWKRTPLVFADGTVLVTIADDQRVRVYHAMQGGKGGSGWAFELKYEVTTYFVEDWHTLTYLGLCGRRIAVVSQNGFLFIWDAASSELLFAKKVHLGSLEGLVWKDGVLAVCSSDMSVTIADLAES